MAASLGTSADASRRAYRKAEEMDHHALRLTSWRHKFRSMVRFQPVLQARIIVKNVVFGSCIRTWSPERGFHVGIATFSSGEDASCKTPEKALLLTGGTLLPQAERRRLVWLAAYMIITRQNRSRG